MTLTQETNASNVKDYEGVIGIVTLEQLKHCLFFNNNLKEVKKHDIFVQKNKCNCWIQEQA